MGAHRVVVATLLLLVVLLLGFCCKHSKGEGTSAKSDEEKGVIIATAGAVASDVGDCKGVIIATAGAVASDVGDCSKIGVNALKNGGHAVDAAVATALCLGVVSGASSGIGGGSFMLLRDNSSGLAYAYNMRETAPALAHRDMYASNPEAKSKGPLSIAVPGELAGLYSAWLKYGKLPWKSLVTPAITLAKGFHVGPYLAYEINSTRTDILQDPGLRGVYSSNGTVLKKGDICRNPQLAKTLTAIAHSGPKIFYDGSIGSNLVCDIQKAGGIIKMSDLQNYKVSITEALSADIMGYKILSMPPPSSGGAGLILVLNILASYNRPPSAVKGNVGTHRTIEALKHMYATRIGLGDPNFVNDTELLSKMLSPVIAAELKKKIVDNETFGPDYYGIKNYTKWHQVKDQGTSHFCIVDKDGNAISMTTTVNAYFGSKFLSPSTGIILNNEMDDFSVPSNTTSQDTPPPAPANFIQPFKRPMSSMTPTIVLKDGQLKAVLGGSGGSNIPAATVEVFLNVLWKNMIPYLSVREPRLYHQWIPNVVDYDNWTSVLGDEFKVSKKLLADLKRRCHKLQGISIGAITQLIVYESFVVGEGGILIAVSDQRKAGQPCGYDRESWDSSLSKFNMPKGHIKLAFEDV